MNNILTGIDKVKQRLQVIFFKCMNCVFLLTTRWQPCSINIHHFPWLSLLFWGCNCCYAANIHHIIHSDSILPQSSEEPLSFLELLACSEKLNHMSWSKQVLLSRTGRMKGWTRGGWKGRTKLGWDEGWDTRTSDELVCFFDKGLRAVTNNSHLLS